MAVDVDLEVTEPAHVGAARRAVAQLVAEEDADLADTVRLTVSEIVTNAIVHGEPPVSVHAHVREGCLRIEVVDSSADRGVPQQVSAASTGGRGLAIVHAVADRWGVETRGRGKAVWLEFSLATAAEAPGTVVQLPGVPVATYLRSQEQLESALHELHVLAASDPAAFKLIEAQTLLPLRQSMATFTTARTRGRAEAEAAASAGRTVVDFTWTLPPEAAEGARVYASGVAELDRLSTEGVLLTPPADHDVARLRQWLSTEIAEQLTTGRAAVPFI